MGELTRRAVCCIELASHSRHIAIAPAWLFGYLPICRTAALPHCCTVGRSGRSISLVTQYDVEVVQRIEALIGKKLEEFSLEEEDVLEYFKETLVAKRKARMVCKQCPPPA